MGQKRALAITMATEFSICATPGGTGGPVTYAWLVSREGLSTARAAALYVVDQIIDLVFFLTALIAFGVYWLLFPSDLHPGWQLLALSGLMLSGFAVMFWMARHYRVLVLALGRMLRRLGISDARRRMLARRIIEFRQGLGIVRHYPAWRIGSVYLLCTGHWLLRYSILYLAVRSLGASIDWSYAFVVQMLSLSAGHLTFMPGGSGGAEASGTLLLLPYMDASTAAAAVLVWRFVTFHWYLIAGGVVFAMVAGRPLWQRMQRIAGNTAANP